MLAMAGQRDDKGALSKPRKNEERQARLEQALRANLLKRKAQNRSRKAPEPPPKEGGQSRG